MLRAELLSEVGRYKEALGIYDSLIKADEKNERAWALRKQVARTLGRKDIVEASADHFFTLFNDNADDFPGRSLESDAGPAGK